MRSRHQKEVATGAKQLTEPLCRDVASKLETVATSALKQKQSRHQFAKKIRSRHHKIKRAGRYKIKLSRHQLHRKEVATTLVIEEGRDNTWLSRHQLHRTEGRDIIYQSRHQIQKEKRSRQTQAVATPTSLKTCNNQTRPLRHNLRQQQVATRA